MGWFGWLLASAFFLAFYDLCKKSSVHGNAVLPVLLCSSACGFAAFAASLLLTGNADAIRAADLHALLLGLSKSVIVAVSWIFTFTALRTLPITIATPIRASSPALVFVLALLLYGEVPTPVQAVGMILVFAGYWTFSWAGRAEGIDFLRNRAVWCAVAGAVMSAFSAVYDKYVFQLTAARTESVQLCFQLCLVLVYAALFLVFRRRPTPACRPLVTGFRWRWTIPFVGILLAAADWLYFRGLHQPGAPVSVASLLRRFSVVITFVVGAALFREHNLRRKSLALAAVLLGILLLVIGE